MKGTNHALDMCINQCIVNGLLSRAKIVKGDNSGHYKIINNERELRYVVYPQSQSAFKYTLTLHLYQAIQATSED